MDLNRILASRRLPPGAREWLVSQRRRLKQTTRRMSKPATIPLLITLVVLPVLGIVNIFTALAANGTMYVSGVTFPLNGVWLDGASAGHYWNAGGNGLCRVDADATSPTGFIENLAACDTQVASPTQAVVGPQNADGTYFVYAADRNLRGGGPVRLVFDPTADGGNGLIVANSLVALGGLNTVGFFADAQGIFRDTAVALGPCNHSVVNPVVEDATTGPCLALYTAFNRSNKIERINWADKDPSKQTIELVSTTTDPRKGARFGIASFKNADGKTDLYVNELNGNGVSLMTDIATCPPNTNGVGGCAVSITPIPTFSAQGIAVLNNPDGTGQYVYVADSPRDGPASVLRYSPSTGFVDLITSAVPAYDSLLNPGETVNTYQFILGLGLNPHNGDLFVGDDPTFALAVVNPPLNMGHLWIVPGTAAPDCVGSAVTTCGPTPPPSQVTADLYAYGATAPKGGVVLLPSDDGGHLWLGDHSQGFCRLDQVPGTGLHAINSTACDDGTSLGSVGQAIYEPTANADGTHYVYVAQNDVQSPGVWRFTYDAHADGGKGMLVGTPVVMAPNAGVDGNKANALALGPNGALYLGGLIDGFIRRVNNPTADPRVQTVDVVAETQDSRGINGTWGMLGDNLYIPENNGFTVLRNASQCPTVTPSGTTPCPTESLPIGNPGLTFGTGIATDPDLTRSRAGLVYASTSPGAANAAIYQYDVASNTARVYVGRGQMPPAGSADATVYCTLTCTRPIDPAQPPGSSAPLRFAQGLLVEPTTGTLFMTEDAFAGARGGRGHIWLAQFAPYPNVPVVPTPTPSPTPLPTQLCTVTINVPSLAQGNTYWVQFTAHSASTLKATWTIPVAQSAQLLLYSGNPFAGLADPVAKGPTGKPIAVQNTSNTQSFSITASGQPAGTYTVQFFNGSRSFAATTGSISFTNDAASPCPASPAASNILN
jgi:hypothetical protein